MIYVITEDENSARHFWESVFKIYNKTFTMIPLMGKNGGNKTLDSQINDAFAKYLKSGDTLFIAFDNIANTKSFNASNLITKTTSRCKKNNIKLYITKYYCFEELYLSYIELVNMCSNRLSKNVLDALKYVNNEILSGRNYYIKSNKHVQTIINLDSDAGKNREHFANMLLIRATSSLNSYFRILKKKGKFGECWIQDCTTIQANMNQHQQNNICNNQCNFICKNCNAMDKLDDLQNKSLQSNYTTKFSNI